MDFEKKKIKAQQRAERIKQKYELHEIAHANDKDRKPWTFSKKLTAFVIANCLVIEIFALVAMWHFMDLSPLPALITAVVGDCIAVIGYLIKSTFENCQGGITYDLAMMHLPSEISKEEKENAVG